MFGLLLLAALDLQWKIVVKIIELLLTGDSDITHSDSIPNDQVEYC